MKLTKYEHACFTLEKEGKLLVVDPGNLTDDLPLVENVVAIMVTHEHSDHFDIDAIRAIVSHNPEAVVYGPKEVVVQLGELPGHSVQPGEDMTVGPFDLRFFGGIHQKPFNDSPQIANVAVLINDSVYHASDSFVAPELPVNVLILPISGSWMSAQMARDFLFAIKPGIAVPSHDAILSDKGKAQADRYWPGHCERVGARYLRPTEPFEIEG